jgi:hypothetical protein
MRYVLVPLCLPRVLRILVLTGLARIRCQGCLDGRTGVTVLLLRSRSYLVLGVFFNICLLKLLFLQFNLMNGGVVRRLV